MLSMDNQLVKVGMNLLDFGKIFWDHAIGASMQRQRLQRGHAEHNS